MLQTTITELVQRASALAARPGRTMLGIVGPPGAGKTTVCDALLASLGQRAALVGMDGFHLDNEVLVALGRRERKGAPDTFDVSGYVSFLTRLREQDEDVIYGPRFDRALELAIGSAIPVPREARLVITEGNYLLHTEAGWDAVRPMLDEVWYLHVDPAEMRRRLVGRRMSHGETEETALAWVTGVDEVNASWVTPSRDAADVVFNVSQHSQTGA